MNTMRKIRISHRVHLIIDHNDEATPAMVESGRYASTYDCAMANGEVDNEITLTEAEITKLESYSNDVVKAYSEARKDNPEYN